MKILLISNNFGCRKNDPTKDRKAIETYVTLRGYKNGGDRKSDFHNGNVKLTLEDIAKELKMSKTNLTRALRIERNLTEPMKELVDEGTLSKTLAADIIASLSKQEQEQLISSLDVTKSITQREVQQFIDKQRKLESQKSDYSLENKNKELKKQIEQLKKENSDMELINNTLKASKEATERLMNSYKNESEEYTKMKNKMVSLGLQPDGAYNILELSNDITKLTTGIEELLSTQLSPIRFSKILPVVKSNTALKRNISILIQMVNDWCKSMADTIGVSTDETIIDMEESYGDF